DKVTVAVLAADDLGENAAASDLANGLVQTPNLQISPAFTGRVNIYAKVGGMFQVGAAAIAYFNEITPAITIATLPDNTRVTERALVATVKVIPYGLPARDVERAVECAKGALDLAPHKLRSATLILTKTACMKEALLAKGQQAVEARLQSLNCAIENVVVVPHETLALSEAIKAARGAMVLILTASATSDVNDVGPSALLSAGGKLTRFGMPVDPGNLLFLGEINDRPVIGLPGCARSPALNGADWVLERISCGLDVTSHDIAAMGVGGLLKEIPTRPQPRGGVTQTPVRPRIEVLLLAAGGSRRMRGRDKLLEVVDDEPLLRRSAQAVLNGQVDRVHVVLQPDNAAREVTLEGLEINKVIAIDWQEGMAASIRAGMAALSENCDAVIVALADMPEVNASHINALTAAFDPTERREICRAMTVDGTPGLPVLFGRRFFETLGSLQGDRGARDVIKDATEFLVDVPTEGQGAAIDLDTPEAWENWSNNRNT
ncbi:MAG: NTP transferase domain-containing protein, partial [Alphaproteobacteria bacterium]